jgi:S1-C subfamily serine protease
MPSPTSARSVFAVAFAVVLSGGIALRAQTLGDLARRAPRTEGTRSKSYSDKDLQPDPRPVIDVAGIELVEEGPAGPVLGREEIVKRVMPSVVTLQAGIATGTGFVVAPGLVLTNRHVVGDASSVTIRLSDGQVTSGTVNSVASDADLALVRASALSAPALTLGSATRLQPGEEVLAIGSALGVLQSTVTRGIVSAVRQVEGLLYVQTDAAINPGNSGGPLVDSRGRVVAINTSKMSGAESIGFAIAVDHARRLIDGQTAVASHPGSAPANQTVAPILGSGPGSEADERHHRGVAQFESVVKTLAQRAAELDVQWSRYENACGTGTRSAGRRAWFGVWETASAGSQDPRADCRTYRADLVGYAARIDTTMTLAGEAARQAGVYPGETREIRRRYAMDWPGWDR